MVFKGSNLALLASSLVVSFFKITSRQMNIVRCSGQGTIKFKGPNEVLEIYVHVMSSDSALSVMPLLNYAAKGDYFNRQGLDQVLENECFHEDALFLGT
jgi:hypothetical protein